MKKQIWGLMLLSAIISMVLTSCIFYRHDRDEYWERHHHNRYHEHERYENHGYYRGY